EGVHTLTDAERPGVNQGMGLFTFTPAVGKKYELKIDSPIGIEGKYPLPQAKADGVVMTIVNGVGKDVDPIRMTLRNSQIDRNLMVGAYCRGRLLDHQRITVKKGQAIDVDLKPAKGVGGVYRVTVFEERGGQSKDPTLVPVAERLLYRMP